MDLFGTMYVRKVRAPVMAALLALLVGHETSSVHVRKVRASVMAAMMIKDFKKIKIVVVR